MREKLCIKVKKREEQTQYFLTVFEKKLFGNEKTYEKRITFRKYQPNLNNLVLEFHPQGGYLYMKVELTSPQSTELQLIFPLDDSNKDPLMVKTGSEKLGFTDKLYYCKKGENVFEYDLKDYNKMKTIPLGEKKKEVPKGDAEEEGAAGEGKHTEEPAQDGNASPATTKASTKFLISTGKCQAGIY